jgi:ribonucleoside-diphosphate reductase alpha chain
LNFENVPDYNPEGFALDIFKQRYAFTEEETWIEACQRVARQVSIAEEPAKQRVYYDRFEEVLRKNLFVPGGRIWYNSGRTNAQLLNCFVLGNQLDSKEGWGSLAKEVIITSMTGGGCGIDFSDVRPRGSPIGDQKGDCPGPVELMQLINGCAKPIKAGGQRRVALMFSLDLHHPDILEFLDAKLVKGQLTYANVSVRSQYTKDFIRAIEKNQDWELSWKNKFKSKVNARLLWDQIVVNAYHSAEPGFLNWELAESESTVSYITKLCTTNPCGEQPLTPYDCCDLGHLVLPRFISGSEINWSLLGNTIRLGVRFLDNVLIVNSYPLQEMKLTSEKLRRVGLGVTGLGDLLAILGYKYGSEECNKFIDKLFRFISKAAYEASIMLAIEKGPFNACNPEKHIETGFVKRMPAKIRALILEHGIRNSAVLTVAPTGTTSIISGNVSSGIEPMFAPAYERRYWDKEERKVELVFHPLFADFMRKGKSVSHFVGASDLSIREHLEVQAIVQKHIDSAVSKTINMPYSYPVQDMSDVWLEYLPRLKGTTFYREKTRGYVNEKGEIEEPPLKAISLEEATTRFKNKEAVTEEATLVDDCITGVCKV